MIYQTHFTPCTWENGNKGQNAERDAVMTLLHYAKKLDNIKGTDEPDFYFRGYGIQCKSARATVCNGTNYLHYITRECACDMFCFVSYKDSTLYFMDKVDFVNFVHSFGFVDIGSDGKQKIRLRKESYGMREWLYMNTKKDLSELQ